MKKVKVTRLFKELFASDKTIVIQRGGARSGKTIANLQYLIHKMTSEPGAKILITRRTMPSLRMTAYKDFIDLLKSFDYYKYCEHSRTHNTINYPNGSLVVFASIDNPERIKSTEWNYILMEEATEFLYADYTILKTRLSAQTKTMNQLLMSFNPTSAFSWIKVRVLDVEKNIHEIVSTFKDNPFLSKAYVETLKELEFQDANAWRVFGLGEWGSLDHVIYSNWSIVDKYPRLVEEQIFGLDFGFSHPATIIQVGVREEGVYLKERLCKSGLTNSDLIKKIKYIYPGQTPIYADGSLPGNILEIRKAGYNIRAADRKPHSVKEGLDYCKRKKLYVTKDSVNLIKELSSYSYKTNNATGEVLEEPIKFGDDCCDAFRYALYSHFAKKKDLAFIVSD